MLVMHLNGAELSAGRSKSGPDTAGRFHVFLLSGDWPESTARGAWLGRRPCVLIALRRHVMALTASPFCLVWRLASCSSAAHVTLRLPLPLQVPWWLVPALPQTFQPALASWRSWWLTLALLAALACGAPWTDGTVT
jgi:hypothetical protein